MQPDIRAGVRQAYSAAADNPQARHPFPVGRQFAESLGYSPDMLAGLPAAAVDAFAGVSNVAVFAEFPPGATVLDLGCGAGLDSLLAARRVGPAGQVIGIDFSEAMLQRARQAAVEAGISNVEFRQADAENLDLDDASIDVALVNGIFNLNPARDCIFRELARVMRPGGAVFAAELILREPLPPEAQASETNWFA
ncbi:MAG TPA: methyltransferase domain-containing protein [Anaerolineae bacterium]|nr:methyltransferase domain-containing protein [Anaerolineae bacterium]